MGKLNKIKKFGKGLLIGLASLLTLNTISIPITYFINRCINPKEKTVVFTSGYDPYVPLPTTVISKFIDFFMYIPITLRQNLRGNHVDWYSNASKDTVLAQLANHDYNNIVFIGHGDKSTYNASDGEVLYYQIVERGIPKRSGELIQHTCGIGDGKSLREVLLVDPNRGYSFDERVNPLENYLRAWVELFR